MIISNFWWYGSKGWLLRKYWFDRGKVSIIPHICKLWPPAIFEPLKLGYTSFKSSKIFVIRNKMKLRISLAKETKNQFYQKGCFFIKVVVATFLMLPYPLLFLILKTLYLYRHHFFIISCGSCVAYQIVLLKIACNV